MVRYLDNAIALHITQLLWYCEKDNLCSLLDSGRQIFYWLKWLKLTMQTKSKHPAVSSGEESGLPSQTEAGNQAYLSMGSLILLRTILMAFFFTVSIVINH